MTRDDVIRLAREAGGEDGWGLQGKQSDPELMPTTFVFEPSELKRFATLVIEESQKVSKFNQPAQKQTEFIQDFAEIRRVFEIDEADYPPPDSGFAKL